MRASVPPTSTIHDIRALFEKDTPTAQCQPWCQPVDDHIRWCKCSGCEFAQSGMKIGDTCSIDPDLKCKPVDDNDLPFESCSTWCSERSKSAAASWKKATAITIQIPVVSPAPKRRLVGYDVSPRVARR